ncbi:MAG: hypothetical protein QXV32_05670 [Conexivisphaerales archaeon]
MSFTLYAVASTEFTQLNVNSQYQLYPEAEQLMQSFLLNPGIPYNWGTNVNLPANNLQYFGLAVQPQTGLAYSLDPSKLNRIANLSYLNNSLYIPPNVAGALLGIYHGNHFDYGFDFRMLPALNITIVNSTNGIYTVYVSDYAGIPAINANVNVSYFAFCEIDQGSGQPQFFFNATRSYNVTNLFGYASFKLSKPSLPQTCLPGNGQGKGSGNAKVAYLVMASANYYGIEFQNFLSYATCKADMILEGQYLLANFNPSNNNCYDVNGQSAGSKGNGNGNNGSVHVGAFYTVFEVTSSLNVIINPAVVCSDGQNSSQQACTVLNAGNKNSAVVQLAYPVSESVIFAGLIITTNGRNFFEVASNPLTNPYGYIEYSSNNLSTLASQSNGTKQAHVDSAVTVSRFVNVGQNTWYASLTVWRMGQS